MKEKYEAFMPNLNSFNKEIWEERYFKELNYKEKTCLVVFYHKHNTLGVLFFFSDYDVKGKLILLILKKLLNGIKKNRRYRLFYYGMKIKRHNKLKGLL